MRRREFIAGLGSAATWPVVARAQHPDRTRLIGVLLPYSESDAQPQAWLSKFMGGLSELGWADGRNLRMDIRWTAGSVDRGRMLARELVSQQPEVIFTDSTPQTAALQSETRAIPI